MHLHDLLADLAGFDGAGVLDTRIGPDASADLSGVAAVDVASVVHDSRAAGPGSLFCCIRGEVTDGHRYAADAVAAGAVALLVEEWLPLDVPQARVASVRGVLGPLAARFQGEPSFAMRTLGVTGTNGKTTTTYLLEAIARAAGDTTGVIGTVGARIGDSELPNPHTTPEATDLQVMLAAMRDSGVGTVAMEVSSHALDQHRVDATHFAATCFTNLTHDHLDYHGTIDAYFESKARLFTPMFTSRVAVNIGDPRGEELAQRAAGREVVVTRYAVGDAGADVSAQRVELRADGTTFELVACRSGPVPVRTTLVGPFNVVNAVAAATTALLAGFELDAIVAGLEAPTVVPGRMERIDAGQDFTVFVDYAHTPDALDAAILAARGVAGAEGRVIVVFGCGGDRDPTKRPRMGEIAARAADLVFVTSDNPRSEDPAAIVDDIVAGIPRGHDVERVLDRRVAIADAVGVARAGDVVLVAGKGHEPGQIIGDRVEPFDDRSVAREAIEARATTATATAREIAHHAHGEVVAGTPDAVVTSWAFDSRALESGACFVALHGDRDGHAFVGAAFAAGARVALVSEPLGITPPVGGAVVRVDDVLRRLQQLAQAARTARDELRVVGVTGSTGKTSTKDLLAAVLAPLGCYASPASYNNEFGLPITLLNAPGDTNVLVAEMGERYPGDVADLCAIARPDAGVVTNVGLAHAEHLGGAEGAARALSELLEALPADGVGVCNADDEWTPRLTAAPGVVIVTAGTDAAADYRIETVEVDEQLRPTFFLRGQRFHVPLHGAHQAVNAALALAVAHRVFGVELADAADALAVVRPARWRLEVLATSAGVTVLSDAYNANPTSMDAALQALAGTPTEGRRIAVLGDMRELGVHSDDAHTAVGVRAGELHLDALVGVGAGGRAIATAAAATVPDVRTAPDAATALAMVREMAEPGDTVLVKASRAVGLEAVADRLLEDAP